MSQTYDLVVIGAGSGGVRAARVAADLGANVAIIEEYRLGGTCVIRGCVPKKLFVYASRFTDMFSVAESFGWQVDARFDWSTLVANKDKEIARLEAAYVSGLEKPGVEIIRDRGELVDANTIHLVNGKRDLKARYILIATGGHPYTPDIPGKELGITSNEAFHLKRLPRSILIEGGGYIAVEFATIFVGLGVDVTLNYRGQQILRGFDADVRTSLEAGLEARGIKLIYETTIRSLKRKDEDISVEFSDGNVAPYGAVMFATGRRANIHGLGLDKAGVELTPDNYIAVDAYSKTSVDSIYAVGDVTGRAALTPLAIREGQAFAETLFGGRPTAADLSLLPTAVFAEPEVGVIGLTEEEALTGHPNLEVYLTRFRPMMNTLSTRSDRVMMKLITDANAGKVLGVHIVGPSAAEMIQLVAIPMAMGATKLDFDRAIAVHPTAAEELVTFKAPTYRYKDGIKL